MRPRVRACRPLNGRHSAHQIEGFTAVVGLSTIEWPTRPRTLNEHIANRPLNGRHPHRTKAATHSTECRPFDGNHTQTKHGTTPTPPRWLPPRPSRPPNGRHATERLRSSDALPARPHVAPGRAPPTFHRSAGAPEPPSPLLPGATRVCQPRQQCAGNTADVPHPTFSTRRDQAVPVPSIRPRPSMAATRTLLSASEVPRRARRSTHPCSPARWGAGIDLAGATSGWPTSSGRLPSRRRPPR
jgi:hypothetical protein